MNTMGTMRDYETEHVQVRFIKKSNFIKTISETETESKPGTEKDHRSHKNKNLSKLLILKKFYHKWKIFIFKKFFIKNVYSTLYSTGFFILFIKIKNKTSKKQKQEFLQISRD